MNHDNKQQFLVTIYPQEDDSFNTSGVEIQGLLENYYDDVSVTEVE